MTKITESEKIAIEQVLGIKTVHVDFDHFLTGYNQETKDKIIDLRNAIDAIVNSARAEARQHERDFLDLSYLVKELIYRIEERRDIRNDLIYKEIKHEMRVF